MSGGDGKIAVALHGDGTAAARRAERRKSSRLVGRIGSVRLTARSARRTGELPVAHRRAVVVLQAASLLRTCAHYRRSLLAAPAPPSVGAQAVDFSYRLPLRRSMEPSSIGADAAPNIQSRLFPVLERHAELGIRRYRQ